jgi:Tfp pilus assembly protein PilP
MKSLLTCLIVLIAAASPAAQAAAGTQTAVVDKPSPNVAKDAVVDAPIGGDTYEYKADGRRDPFASLIGAGTDPRPTSKTVPGPAGFILGDISVRGVVQSRESLVAMIQGPDNRTYLVHRGDKFADGVVRNITPQGLVVLQDITDPLSAQKQREVRKLLRSLEGAKE